MVLIDGRRGSFGFLLASLILLVGATGIASGAAYLGCDNPTILEFDVSGFANLYQYTNPETVQGSIPPILVDYNFEPNQSLIVEATGEVMDHGTTWTGPDGWSWSFRGLRVYSLIGRWGNSSGGLTSDAVKSNPFFVGSYAELTAPDTQNNFLYLAENDGIFSDNAGAYHVKVTFCAVNEYPAAYIDSIAPSPAVQGMNVSFIGRGVDQDGAVVAYNWRSSIDGFLSDRASFSTSSLSVGNHTVYFKVQDDKGAWSSEVSAMLEVIQNQPPVAVASAYPSMAYVSENISFSSAGSYDPDGTIVSYSWQFGDGATSTDANPAHAYANIGKYSVILTVTDDKGAASGYLFLVNVTCKALDGVDTHITNNFDNPAYLIEQLYKIYHPTVPPIIIGGDFGYYIDATVRAILLGNINFDECVRSVDGEYKRDILGIPTEYNERFSKVTSNVYERRDQYLYSKVLDDLIELLTWWIGYRLDLPEVPIDLYPSDVYLMNMYITYQMEEVYKFQQNKKLPTIFNALENLIPTFFFLQSPADISVIDPLGREIGAFYQNGVLTTDIGIIPGVAVYTGNGSEPQWIMFLNPIEGIYKVKVHGRDSGTYNLTIGWIYNDTLINKQEYNLIPIVSNQEYEYSAAIDRTPPNISILAPANDSHVNSSAISWNASDNVGLNYFEILVDGSSRKNISAIGNLKEGTFNATLNLSDGLHKVEVRVFDLANNTASSHVTFTLDTIAPNISAQYQAKIADYEQFRIDANIIDANLAKVIFSQNDMLLNYTVSGDVYSSTCLGPFPTGSSLSYVITAWDKAGNAAFNEFNVTVVESEVKIEGEGKNETVKLELEAKRKNSETKGELELQEKGKDAEKFKAHGKIEKLYKDCSGAFRISGTAKVEYGDGANKTKENLTFSGSIIKDKITITIDGREFAVPAKVNIKEKIEANEKEGGKR